MGIKTVFLAWCPWDSKAPLFMGAYAWARSYCSSKVLVQQQVALLSSPRGLRVAAGHFALVAPLVGDLG